MRTPRILTLAALALLAAAGNAAAQLDPLLYLKKNTPNVLIAVETANRMQRDVYNDYIDPNVYVRQGAGHEAALGFTNPLSTHYRRKFVNLSHKEQVDSADDKFETPRIDIVENTSAAFSTFDARARLAIARLALTQAVTANRSVAAFHLFRTRQDFPRLETPANTSEASPWKTNETARITTNSGALFGQDDTGDAGNNKWKITRPVVSGKNGDVTGTVGPLATTSDDVLTILNRAMGEAGSLIPGGRDAKNIVDNPLDFMLDDLKTHAEALIKADPDCANIVVVLVAGGRRGETSSGDAAAKAAEFLSVSEQKRRVPIYVIGIAPLTSDDRTELQNIAAASGGQFTEITAAMFESAGAGRPIPEFVRAVNFAVSHAFADKSLFTAGATQLSTEHQATSPIIGTVNLDNGRDITGAALENSVVEHVVTKQQLPQRANVMVTAGFSLPGFGGKLRAFRVYRPLKDDSKSTGWKFTSEGTWERRLWVASAPAADSRNIYTALPDGTVVPFTKTMAALLQPYLRTADMQTVDITGAMALIEFIRAQPLGAIVGSTPAIMDPPSLDPPPDSDYPAFAAANKSRRSLVWVGTNDGMLHGIDARIGKEVWAFIPFNLLPKLGTLLHGQPTGDFRFFVDGSPKVADVKVGGQWRTYLVIGQGPGGTFYQTFDVTLDGLADASEPDSDSLTEVLNYFANPASVKLKWAFPNYKDFDVSLGSFPHNGATVERWGDIAAGAPSIAKTVGETWSDPAVGQIQNGSGRFAVITGSGFFKYSWQQQANRNKVVAGTTFYVIDIANGNVLDSRDVGSDGKGETIDNCAAANDCRQLKNALQADPVGTGPPDSRFITKAYIGDLDGRIWRFDIELDDAGVPRIKGLDKPLYTIDIGPANEHPLFASMAYVNVGTTQPYLFAGTGSDLLPSNGITNTQYALLVILDLGTSGSRRGTIKLEATDGKLGDEKVSAFPAVAGDIVFFSTTTYKQGGCALPDANLYAFTFIGGPAYDTTGDGAVCTGSKCQQQDSTKISTVTGARATAPFIVDQHLVFGTGDTVEMFGDPDDFNNGVGQAGVRILSWREVR